MIEEQLLKTNFIGRDGFRWWVGQVAQQKTQGVQVNGGGWGNRFKVRILGYHPYSEVDLPDEDLPWAQVLLGVSDGSGAANRSKTVRLSPSDTVFGFFLDGKDQQVPIIMGCLGNNAKTKLERKLGTEGSGGKNFTPFSFFSKMLKPEPNEQKKT